MKLYFLFFSEALGRTEAEEYHYNLELFKEINIKYNKTIVQVTHSEKAALYGSKLVHLVDGQITSVDDIVSGQIVKTTIVSEHIAS